MVSLFALTLLAIIAGSNQRQGHCLLAQAYQDAAHYYFPSNIYDNLPPNLETPAGVPNIPISSPTSALTQSRPVRSDGRSLSPGPNDPPTIDISTPLLNAVYTPGSDLAMTWSNNGIRFPDNWTPQQGPLDMITNDASFSRSPLLTKDDMTNIAKMELEGLKRTQLVSIMNDSPIWLRSLRLISWPRQPSPSPDVITAEKRQLSIQPDILFDPGYNLQDVSRMVVVGGGAGGQLTWAIPVDWGYEGEFEIGIPSVSSTNEDAEIKVGARSRSFWILRDAASRKSNPQYTPIAEDSGGENPGVFTSEKDAYRHRTLSIVLGVSATMLALILAGLGFVIVVYRRRWAALVASFSNPESMPPGAYPETIPNYNPYSPSWLPTKVIAPLSQNGYPLQGCREDDLFEHAQRDKDAHSRTNLNLSETTLNDHIRVPEKQTTVSYHREHPEILVKRGRLYNPNDGTFVDLPLYDDQDTSSTSITRSRRLGENLHEKPHEDKGRD
ncbi:hypothetical protein BGZ65_005171 [Modicella reniformis]|uniref:Uncharacterized protein n=1 Tax=Modicella reniformis TaxID=1440133 RepID=A0A9P6MGI8_9FUNG|nr:hypothetical protein BGZ65_005171 [Modicella reniformis]